MFTTIRRALARRTTPSAGLEPGRLEAIDHLADPGLEPAHLEPILKHAARGAAYPLPLTPDVCSALEGLSGLPAQDAAELLRHERDVAEAIGRGYADAWPLDTEAA